MPEKKTESTWKEFRIHQRAELVSIKLGGVWPSQCLDIAHQVVRKRNGEERLDTSKAAGCRHDYLRALCSPVGLPDGADEKLRFSLLLLGSLPDIGFLSKLQAL
jgi:hypothetical protein